MSLSAKVINLANLILNNPPKRNNLTPLFCNSQILPVS